MAALRPAVAAIAVFCVSCAPVKDAAENSLQSALADLAADDDADDLPGNEDFTDAAEDPQSFAVSVPRIGAPGTRYRYNSLAAYATGIVILRAADERLEEFARKNLFETLGMERWDWQEDRTGQTKGQGNLFLTARDFAHVGELVLDGGVYDGRQIVSRGNKIYVIPDRAMVVSIMSGAYGQGYGQRRSETILKAVLALPRPH